MKLVLYFTNADHQRGGFKQYVYQWCRLWPLGLRELQLHLDIFVNHLCDDGFD